MRPSAVIAFFCALTGAVLVLADDAQIQEELNKYNERAVLYCGSTTLAAWNVETNLGVEDYIQTQIDVEADAARFHIDQQEEFAKIDLDTITDERLRRQIAPLQKLGMASLSEPRLEEFNRIVNSMSRKFSETVVCPYDNQICDITGQDVLRLDPDMHDIMEKSNDYDELKYVWEQWHDRAGQPIRAEYEDYVTLLNEAARADDFSDAAAMWQSAYEDMDFNTVDSLWEDVKPLYDELHKYVRNKFAEGANAERLAAHEPYLPAHVLGNMWAQAWSGLYERTKPFDIDDNMGDVTATMARLGYTVEGMFERADDFFINLNFKSTATSFDTARAHIRQRTDGVEIACHASAWDFCDGADFRIKMCTSVNLRDFITIHHELGHIAYYQQYAHLPLTQRGGANPAFHEAVGDAIALSFSNPKHLRVIGLLPASTNENEEHERDINALYLMALDRVAFLPFGLLIDKWRWEVFNGTTPPAEWNNRFWELRKHYQQIVPPAARGPELFDAGAKFHVPANSQYIGYFYAGLLQFQMYRSMCVAAGEYDPANPDKAPLHHCDFYKKPAAGELLKAGLSKGTSERWPDVLETITSERTINGAALMEYFQPLYQHLKKANREAELQKVREILVTHDVEASVRCNQLVNANWDSITDLANEAKSEAYLQQIQTSAQFAKDQFETYFKNMNPEDYADDLSVSRQLKFLTKLGTSRLTADRLSELHGATSAMELVYNLAKVCPFEKQNCDLQMEGWQLNPDIEHVMSVSTDFDELRYVWANWHDATGTHMREDYEKYVQISNEAAVLNGFADNGEMWRFEYEDDNFQANMLQLWQQVEPLYDSVHTYVRHKLIDLYGERLDETDPLIPAHLLGNMWAQSWVNVYERIKPFANASDIDVSQTLKEKFTALKMFEESNRFYEELGLESNEMSFTGQSIIEKPEDRLIVCHASAWDFCDGTDYRIKQCTQMTQRDFVTVHHEMGHIQYYIQYAKQPIPFRKGANPGFHEAVGDLIALSVSTPQHLQQIGLLQDYADTTEDNINALLKMALERVTFLPFGLLLDMYRWEVFAGLPKNQWQSRYEELREKFQKIRSPVVRSAQNFDAGAKFHVPSDYQYMNYFVAHILEFQLHKAVCKAAGQLQNGAPLHKCDIDGSREAGDLIRKGLEAGASVHWSETLFAMTGNEDRELKADALLEYFAPLKKYLDEVNDEWVPPSERTEPPPTDPTTEAPPPTTEAPPPSTTETPTQTPPPTNEVDDSLPMVPIIVGAVLFGGLFVGVVVAISYYFCVRRAANLVTASTSKLV